MTQTQIKVLQSLEIADGQGELGIGALNLTEGSQYRCNVCRQGLLDLLG